MGILKTCLVIMVLMFAFTGCTGKANPWLNEDDYYQVKQKIQFNKKAIIRYQQAENSAMQDGDKESASAYRKAKENIIEEMPVLEQRYQVLETERQERLKNQQEHFMNDE